MCVNKDLSVDCRPKAMVFPSAPPGDLSLPSGRRDPLNPAVTGPGYHRYLLPNGDVVNTASTCLDY